MTEHQMYEQIARYLQLHYPEVIYRFDLAADLKLTAGQAAKHKRLHPRRGYPDLFIAEPKTTTYTMEYAGLYLELKAEGNSPFKKDGNLKKDEHIKEQADILLNLQDKGYKAEFAVGFEEAKKLIDDYLRR